MMRKGLIKKIKNDKSVIKFERGHTKPTLANQNNVDVDVRYKLIADYRNFIILCYAVIRLLKLK